MLKSLIVAGHLIGVFFLSFVFSDEISITDTFPESLQVGETYMVTVSITKNDVSGFAKYQIDAPRGVVIKPVELNSASFTFKDGKAKFIWMNLPTASTFDITYEIKVEDGEIGSEKEVNSRLSYLIDNARKIYQGPNHILKIVGEDGELTTHSTTSSEISASRTITPEGDNKFLVEIVVNKLGVKGFAKIQDMIPSGFTATEVMNSEAIFTQTETKVKLVWFDIPKNMTLNISYLLEAPADFEGTADINGKFHYMAGSDLKKIPIPDQSIEVRGDIVSNSIDSDNTETNTEEVSTDNSLTINDPMNADNTTNTVDDLIGENSSGTSTVDDLINGSSDISQKTDDTMDGANDLTTKVDDIETETETASSTINDAINSVSETETTDNVTEASENTEETSSNFLDNFISNQNSTVETDIVDDVNTDKMNGEINTVSENVNSTINDVTEEVAETSNAGSNGNSTSAKMIDSTVDNSMDNSSVSENTSESSSSDEITNQGSSTSTESITTPVEMETTTTVTTEDITDNNTSNSNRSTLDDLLSDGPTKKFTPEETVEDNVTTVNTSSTIDDEGYSNINEPSTTPDMTTAEAEPESTRVAIPTYEKEEVIAEDNNFDEISNFSSPESGINYRVQIMAGKKVVGKEYLRKRHNFESNFNIENHEGWIKYTSGSFGEYKSARDQRNVIREEYNFNGPFVSAYNDGVRITVQEALMISKQKWYN